MNARVEACIAALRAGKPVLISDDADREDETDLVLAAEACTEEQMAFLLRHTSGFVCCAMTRERAEALSLPPMVTRNEETPTARRSRCPVTQSARVRAFRPPHGRRPVGFSP